MCLLKRKCSLSKKKILNETGAFIRGFENKKRRFYTREKVGAHRNSPDNRNREKAKLTLPDIKDPKPNREEAVEE